MRHYFSATAMLCLLALPGLAFAADRNTAPLPDLPSKGTVHTSISDIKPDHFGENIKRQYISGKEEMLAFFTFKKGAVIPWHSHKAEQITHVLKGKLTFNVGNDKQQYHLKEGDVLVIPSNVPHQAVAETDVYEIDVFSPIRKDWIDGKDNYLKTQK